MRLKFFLFTGLILIAACGNEVPVTDITQEGSEMLPATPEFVVMDDNLQQLKEDFNAAAGKIRLVFISGPTCGICLRGMADLNDEFLAAVQNDGRLQTFVIHVPTMGAKVKHVADTIPLLKGPNIHHYWEDSGIIGIHYRDAMDVPMYVWDFWAIYGPHARWDETLPPIPDYFEHQLGVTSGRSTGFTRDRILNAGRFASRTENFLAQLPEPADKSGPGDETAAESLADGTVIPYVGQPRSVAVGQHIRGRGGYQNLKRIQRIEKHGKIQVSGEWLPLRIDMVRPGDIQRAIGSGPEKWVAQSSNEGPMSNDSFGIHGLPVDLDKLLLASFDIDGSLVEWPDKGHKIKMLGMEKLAHVLAWKLDFVHNDGQHWQLFINSHGGGIVKANFLGDDARVRYVIRRSDYRQTDGFTFPYRIEYLSADNLLLAVEEIDRIVVIADAADIDRQNVSH